MVNDRQNLDLTTFARPAGGGAVEWRTSDAPVPYPEAVAAMETRVAAIAAGEAMMPTAKAPRARSLFMGNSPVTSSEKASQRACGCHAEPKSCRVVSHAMRIKSQAAILSAFSIRV